MCLPPQLTIPLHNTQNNWRFSWLLCKPIKNTNHTSCNWKFTLSLLQTKNLKLANAILATTAEFSTRLYPTNKSAHPLPVELTTGFHLLGHPVESHTFAEEIFSSRINNVIDCITSLSHNITDKQTKLKLFSQCLLQKLPHLLASNILYNLPTNETKPKWKEWNGPLTSTID
jgi:hypothetical protein